MDPFKYDTSEYFPGGNAGVVSAHALASDAGKQMINGGGNAFDGPIATQLALAVV